MTDGLSPRSPPRALCPHLRSLCTSEQKRVIAETVLARRDGVHHRFRSNAGWIERTEDPEVRVIAEGISEIVKWTLRTYETRGPKLLTEQWIVR
ncbi:MAG: hypothetical protein K0R99_26 [Microbacterium sp.]|nr:hypothetical protein [Microbacterium sp.]